MKVIFIILISLATTVLNTQQENFDFKDLKFKELDFNTTELSITQSLGKGDKVSIDEDEYACGIFYSDTGEKFYNLKYDHFTFTGNERLGFFIDYIDFDAIGKIKITYKGKALSGLTTKSEFLKVFSNIKKEYFENPEPTKDLTLIYTKYSETAGEFTFKNGLLIRFRYWYLC